MKPLLMDDFPPLVIGAMYQGRPKEVVTDFLELAKAHAKSLT